VLKLNKYFQEALGLFPENSEAGSQEPEKRNKINHFEFYLLPPEFPCRRSEQQACHKNTVISSK